MHRPELEQAVASAGNLVPRPEGWLRRLVARDHSARALIERYRLWPALCHAYDRIARELGPVPVEISAERPVESDMVVLEAFTSCTDFDRLNCLERDVQAEVHSMLGDRRWYRVLVTLRIDPARSAE
jgi:hypothetical protein